MEINITINGKTSKRQKARLEKQRKLMEVVLLNFTRELGTDPEKAMFFVENEEATVAELNKRLDELKEMEKIADKMAGNIFQKINYKLYALNKKRSVTK